LTSANPHAEYHQKIKEAFRSARQPRSTNIQKINQAKLNSKMNERNANLAKLMCHAEFVDTRCRKPVFRSASGRCASKFKLNSNAGMSNAPFNRWLPGKYYDNKFTGEKNIPLTYMKPNVRDISIAIRAVKPAVESFEFTELLTTFGQYLSHDLALSPLEPVGKKCQDSCNREPEFNLNLGCSPIYDNEKRSCFPFVRSATVCDKISPVNEATSFLDASTVYGSNLADMNELRAGRNGAFLRTNDVYKDFGRAWMPFQKVVREKCVGQFNCFEGGDKRNSEVPLLTTMHTLFLREHNRIARKVKNEFPGMLNDRVFSETRKLVEAQHQVLTYEHYLPKVLGPRTAELLNMDNFPRTKYNPATSNIFTAAAFRFAHFNVNPFVQLQNTNFPRFDTEVDKLPIHFNFWRPDKTIGYGVDRIIKGVLNQGMKVAVPENIYAKSLTEHLFRERLVNVSQDLLSMDLARGRDVGLPSYNHWRRFCKLGSLRTWEDVGRSWILNGEQVSRLRRLYVVTRDIDVFLGGVLEKPVGGGLVGPLFRCLIHRQFLLLKNNDDYFHTKDERVVKAIQPIKSRLFAHLICKNTGLKEVRSDPLSLKSPFVPCASLPDINYSAFQSF
jgi:hypothetical protein